MTEDFGRILVCWYGLKLMREGNLRPGVAATFLSVPAIHFLDVATYRAVGPALPLAAAQLLYFPVIPPQPSCSDAHHPLQFSFSSSRPCWAIAIVGVATKKVRPRIGRIVGR